MNSPVVRTALLALILAVTATPAFAMWQDCMDRGALEVYLDQAFAESRVATGELENGNEVDLYTSRRGSWTLVERRAGGLACVHASGTGWHVDMRALGIRQPAS